MLILSAFQSASLTQLTWHLIHDCSCILLLLYENIELDPEDIKQLLIDFNCGNVCI